MPSPALTTLASSSRASNSAAPDDAWRTTTVSTCIAWMFLAVSIRLSPFCTLEVEPLEVDHIRRQALGGESKLVRVRVEDSKNMLAMVLPRSAGTFFTSRADTSLNDSAVFSSSSISARLSNSRESRSCAANSWPAAAGAAALPPEPSPGRAR